MFKNQVEVNSSRHHDLEQSIRGSSVSQLQKSKLWDFIYDYYILIIGHNSPFYHFNILSYLLLGEN